MYASHRNLQLPIFYPVQYLFQDLAKKPWNRGSVDQS
jgi:hypothetical protein